MTLNLTSLVSPWTIAGAIALGLTIPVVSYVSTAFPKNDYVQPDLVKRNSSMVAVRGKLLRVVHIAETKTPSDTTVFMFHGFGGRADQFAGQMEELKSAFNIVSVDMVGHGDSELSYKDEDYAFVSLVDDLEVVFDTYKTTTNFIVGHSYGTMLTTALVQRNHRNVKGVVLVSASGIKPTLPPAYVFNLPDFVWDFVRIIGRLGGESSSSVLSFVDKSAPFEVKHKQLILGMINSTTMVKKMVKGLGWVNLEVDGKALLSLPVMLVSGANDHVTSIAKLEPLQRFLGASARVHILENIGHNVMMEAPEQLSRMLLLFFQEVQPTF